MFMCYCISLVNIDEDEYHSVTDKIEAESKTIMVNSYI